MFAKEQGVSPGALARYLFKNGIEWRKAQLLQAEDARKLVSKEKKLARNSKVSNEDMELAKQFVLEGKTRTEFAKRHGVSQSAVSRSLIKNGIHWKSVKTIVDENKCK